jgi:membrane-associated phospholipid phosphatase
MLTLFKIYLGFFVENTIFSSIIYGLVFSFPLAIYFGITSYLNILFWAKMKSFICKVSILETLRPQSSLLIETQFANVLFKLGKYGMPSFHSIYAGFSAAFWLMYFKNRATIYQKYIIIIFYLLVAGSRIYFNVHTLGQVFIGSILGFISGYIIFNLYP